MRDFTFNVSDRAKHGLLGILKPREALLIDVIPGGCNGFSYNYGIVDCPSIDKAARAVFATPPVFLTDQAMNMLDGATLEYEADELGTSFFSIINPGATSKCSCGASFSIFS